MSRIIFRLLAIPTTLLSAFVATADLPPVATLTLEPSTTMPGLPVAFVVNISNPNSIDQIVWPDARLRVVPASGSNFDATGDAQHRTTGNISTDAWESCGETKCVHVPSHAQRQIYVDLDSALVGNPFYFDRRLSFPGTYSLQLGLSAGPVGGAPITVWTNPATLTVSNPGGADGAVWQHMLQLTDGKGWDAMAWILQGGVLAEEIRSQHPSSTYVPWVVALGRSRSADESLAGVTAALATNPPNSLRDMLLSLKAEIARSASNHAIEVDRDVNRCVAYGDAARDAYNTLAQIAISVDARTHAAQMIPSVYTQATAEQELALLNSKDLPATGRVVPRVECIDVGGDGKLTVQFAYSSPNSANKVLQPGSLNQLSPAPTDQGQPHVFSPGDHPNAFIVHGVTSKLTWRLDGGSATANLSFPARCSTSSGRAAIVPLLGCVTVIGGKRMINLGYDNPNAYEVYLPVGAQNHFDPAPQDRSQTTTFAAGRHANAFQVKLDGNPTWTLDGSVLSIPSDTRSCPP